MKTLDDRQQDDSRRVDDKMREKSDEIDCLH